MCSPMAMSYHMEGVPTSAAIYVSTYTAQAGGLGRPGAGEGGLDSSCATGSPWDTQVVSSLHYALETPGKQGKLSFTMCKDLGAESQTQPISKMLW